MTLENPGYEPLVAEISSIFSGCVLSFIYIKDPVSPRTTAFLVNSVLSSLAHSSDASCRVNHAQVNAVACFAPRLIYDAVINQLADWDIEWAARIGEGMTTKGSSKGKSQQTDDDLADDGQIVIVVELGWSVQNVCKSKCRIFLFLWFDAADLSMIFVLDMPSEDIRPVFGASPDLWKDPNELQYIAVARWPGFIQPILDAHKHPPDEDVNMDGESGLELRPPPEDPLADGGEVQVDDGRISYSPRMAKFILITAYLASTNPHNKDGGMFGRAKDEKKRKRRTYSASAKTGTAKASTLLWSLGSG
ncbi:hypothetical protein DFH07DRAFT_1058068 [Mycena maculata]|uniref:Origin recognition complex subunit 5 C-terminal domain-containing protein n=1 Tax=Mycena maculata TaxID=230809 RepID=A0AAD7NPQ6_9AGAR|nr:hypothetical protein DFH07DRAFT_1058068 [Mycena maculata]